MRAFIARSLQPPTDLRKDTPACAASPGFWAESPLQKAEPIADAMSAAILHRGPDSGSTWHDRAAGLALIHRRLAIVDLSPAGAQPMASACGRYMLCYNGEIYNHRALRAELEADGVSGWRGHSDTETFLALVTRDGLATALERAIGMFAIALWDLKEHKLTLARDRLGEKAFVLRAARGQPAFCVRTKGASAPSPLAGRDQPRRHRAVDAPQLHRRAPLHLSWHVKAAAWALRRGHGCWAAGV